MNIYLSIVKPHSPDFRSLALGEEWQWENTRPVGWPWTWIVWSDGTRMPKLQKALDVLGEQEFFSAFWPAVVLTH